MIGLVLAGAVLSAAPNAAGSIIRQGVEVFYPNSAPRGDIVVHQDDVLARLPILWASAARIDQPIAISVAGKERLISAGALLPEVAVILPENPGATIITYCTPLRHGERNMEHGFSRVLFGNGMLARQIAAHTTSGQFCFFDRDGDSRFDEVRYFDSGLSDGSAPQTIAPLPFTKQVDIPVSLSNQDEIRLTSTHVGHHSLVVALDFVQAGLARAATGVTIGGFSVGRISRLDLVPGGSPSQLGKKFDLDKAVPQSTEILGVDFQIISVDPSGNAITIRFPDNVDRGRILVVPEQTAVHYCFGYSCD